MSQTGMPATAVRAKSPLARWQTINLALLVAGYAGYYLCRSNLSVTLPLIIQELAHKGLGANAAIFSVVDAVLLRSLPFRNADRLVELWEDASHFGFPLAPLAPAARGLQAVTIPDEENPLPAAKIVEAADSVGINAEEASSIEAALRAIATTGEAGRVLICGSLHFAGVVLRDNG